MGISREEDEAARKKKEDERSHMGVGPVMLGVDRDFTLVRLSIKPALHWD